MTTTRHLLRLRQKAAKLAAGAQQRNAPVRSGYCSALQRVAAVTENGAATRRHARHAISEHLWAEIVSGLILIRNLLFRAISIRGYYLKLRNAAGH